MDTAAPIVKAVEPPASTHQPTGVAQTSTLSKQPLEGYKFVKVKRPDGKVVTVQRKLAPGEEPPKPQPAGPPFPAGPAAKDNGALQKFKIVTIARPDGSVVKVKRPIKPEDEAAGVEAAATTQVANKKPSIVGGNTTGAVSLPKVQPDVAKTEKDASPETPINVAPATKEDLEAQKLDRRERRISRFKSSLIGGLGSVIAGSVPAMEFGDFADGDEIISDSDWSQEDDWDDLDDLDEKDLPEYNEKVAHDTQDDAQANDETTRGVTFDAGAAVGGVAAAMAANAAKPPPPQAASQPQRTTAPGLNEKNEKEITYKVTAQDIKNIEDEEAQKAESRRLARHWANFSFYFMASLSVLLPVLFVVLGAFIFAMDGKTVSGSWGVLQDVIKVAVSAWPIVFAAVVAQAFKAWATYKVERGIKLMELEQLVGSHSFGSAIKQPLTLRSLNLLALGLFAVWCLSPVGSQALQRVYSTGFQVDEKNMIVSYLDTTGWNREFTNASLAKPSWYPDVPTDARWVADKQLMENYYSSSFMPIPSTNDSLKIYMDKWNHPHIPLLTPREGELERSAFVSSAYGVPTLLSESIFDDLTNVPVGKLPTGETRWESVHFTMDASYYQLDCSDLQTKTGTEIRQTVTAPWFDNPDLLFETASKTLFFKIWRDYDTLALASLNRAPSGRVANVDDVNVTVQDLEDYTLVFCKYRPVVLKAEVWCDRDETRKSGAECQTGTVQNVTSISDEVKANLELNDFSYYYVTEGILAGPNSPTSQTEIFLRHGEWPELYDAKTFRLADAGKTLVEARLTHVFNTWIKLGYCTRCTSYAAPSNLNTLESNMFRRVNGTWSYTAREIFYVDYSMAGLNMACAVLLLLSGMIGVFVESRTVAPDVLGYVSTVARNSRYIQTKKTNSAMSGGERTHTLGTTKVMMQDVKAKASVGKIALGMKHENAHQLRRDRLYR